MITCEACVHCEVGTKMKEVMVTTIIHNLKKPEMKKVKAYYCNSYREDIGNLSRAEKCKRFAAKRTQSTLDAVT